jgi:hypothetical protein
MPDIIPDFDELGRLIATETGAEKLKRLAKSTVITDATSDGPADILAVTYPSQEHKVGERFEATQENPDDVNGLGYTFTNTTGTGV